MRIQYYGYIQLQNPGLLKSLATLSFRQEGFQSFCQIVTEIDVQTRRLVNLTGNPFISIALPYIFQLVINSNSLA